MLLFGHIGLSLGVGKIFEFINNRPLYLFLGIGAIFPDIDKIISIIFGLGGRALFHTLLFAVALTLVSFFAKKKQLANFSLGVWLHLLLDTIWVDPETLFWPLFGTFSQHRFNFVETFATIYSNPVILIGEIAGFVIFLHHSHQNNFYKNEINIFLKKINLNKLIS